MKGKRKGKGKREKFLAMQRARKLKLAIKFARSAIDLGVDRLEAARLGAQLYRVAKRDVRAAIMTDPEIGGQRQ